MLGSNISPCVSHKRHFVFGVSPGAWLCICCCLFLLRFVFFTTGGLSGSWRSQCVLPSRHLFLQGLPRMLMPVQHCFFARGALVGLGGFRGLEWTLHVSIPSTQNLRHWVPFAVIKGQRVFTGFSFFGFTCFLSSSTSSWSFLFSRTTWRNTRVISSSVSISSLNTSMRLIEGVPRRFANSVTSKVSFERAAFASISGGHGMQYSSSILTWKWNIRSRLRSNFFIERI